MKSRVPLGETKEERFKRVIALRVKKLLKDLRLLGNLANKNFYSYTDEDINKIFLAIEEGLERAKSLFYVNMVSVDDILHKLWTENENSK